VKEKHQGNPTVRKKKEGENENLGHGPPGKRPLKPGDRSNERKGTMFRTWLEGRSDVAQIRKGVRG